MKLAKAIEILTLNVKEAGKKMPPDTLTALKLGTEALKRIKAIRPYSNSAKSYYLPGEDSPDPTEPSPDKKKRLRESPLGKV